MPCDSSHMDPLPRERELSKVLAFLEELRTGKLNEEHFKGYHPAAYCTSPTQKQLDDATAQLCEELRALPNPETAGRVSHTNHSLELQIWWRDHQRHDAEREQREQRERERQTSLKNRIAELIEDNYLSDSGAMLCTAGELAESILELIDDEV